jgi:hypothetical protein
MAVSYATTAVRFAVVPMGTVIAGVVTLTEIGSITTVACFDCVGSVTEVAVMVTTPPAGIAAGAVYVIWPVLAVWVGLGRPDCSDPHVATFTPLAQLQLQLRPAALGSLVTVAESSAAPFTPSSAGAGIEIEMVIGAGTIGNVTLAETDESLAAIAVIVTELPTGISVGGV